MRAPTPLVPCPRCGRHHRATERACPFCGSRRGGGTVLNTAAAGLSALVLMACYAPGPMGGPDTGLDSAAVDADADGYTVGAGDCDDEDAAVNPGATEVCDDGIDNDCDGKTDTDDEDCATD